MQVKPTEGRLFYKLYAALMCYVNRRLEIVPGELTVPDEYLGLTPTKRTELRAVLFERRELIDDFVQDNPFRLSADELEPVHEWKRAVFGNFVVFRYLKKHTIFLNVGDDCRAYGVLGLADPLEKLVGSSLPKCVETVLLPFQGKIIYDGVLNFVNVAFGGGLAQKLNECYREARAHRGIITSLPVDGSEKDQAKPVKKKAKSRSKLQRIYQFKISLKHVRPPIWRRIQVEDCTLDKLHEHIQAAMGWTNSHLHQFEIDGKIYGDPELLDGGFGASYRIIDSRRQKLSRLLPKDGSKFRFQYEYDFGDWWEHDIVFERTVESKPGIEYPVCVKGKRACPPEDCGGPGGYEYLIEVVNDPDHKEHENMLEWLGDPLDDEFDPASATERMRQGLSGWRLI